MLQDNMTALEIIDNLYKIKVSGLSHDLLRMFMNILDMTGQMSQLEAEFRKTRARSVQNDIDVKRQEIFNAIALYEQYALIQKLMS